MLCDCGVLLCYKLIWKPKVEIIVVEIGFITTSQFTIGIIGCKTLKCSTVYVHIREILWINNPTTRKYLLQQCTSSTPSSTYHLMLHIQIWLKLQYSLTLESFRAQDDGELWSSRFQFLLLTICQWRCFHSAFKALVGIYDKIAVYCVSSCAYLSWSWNRVYEICELCEYIYRDLAEK